MSKNINGNITSIYGNYTTLCLPLKEDLTALTTEHHIEALLEVIEVETVSNHRTQIQTTNKHLLHLVPSLPHAATSDTFDSQCVEDNV